MAEASPSRDLVATVLGVWITAGGFLDGFAHRALDTPETFFTPWHALLYSGFLAATAWMIFSLRRGRGALPDGYGLAAVGLAVFAAGGLGDLIWHVYFGIEVSVDALLSPTHLMLLVGALLFVTAPVRSAWANPTHRLGGLMGWFTLVVPLTMATAEVGFFFQYLDGFGMRFGDIPYDPVTQEGFFPLAAGIASILVTTVILIGALLLLIRRWPRPPFGTGLALIGGFGLLMEALEGFHHPRELVAPLVGGVAADALFRVVRVRIAVFAVPVLMWSAHFAVYSETLVWPPSVWGGVIVFSGLAAVGLSLLAYPPGQPVPQAKVSQPPS